MRIQIVCIILKAEKTVYVLWILYFQHFARYCLQRQQAAALY